MGPGAFRVSGVDGVDMRDLDFNSGFAAWSMVVFYEDMTQPLRNLALFDGFDLIQNGNGISNTLTGFRVPNAGFDAKLGVVAYEGTDYTPPSTDSATPAEAVTGDAGSYANLYVDSSGKEYIAFYDAAWGDLRLAVGDASGYTVETTWPSASYEGCIPTSAAPTIPPAASVQIVANWIQKLSSDTVDTDALPLDASTFPPAVRSPIAVAVNIPTVHDGRSCLSRRTMS
jgi:hypothetical protein